MIMGFWTLFNRMITGAAGMSPDQEHFERTVQKKELPTDIPEVTLDDDELSAEDLIFRAGLADSKSEAKRLIQQGGVEIDGTRVSDENSTFTPTSGMIIKVGKRKIIKVKIS